MDPPLSKKDRKKLKLQDKLREKEQDHKSNQPLEKTEKAEKINKKKPVAQGKGEGIGGKQEKEKKERKERKESREQKEEGSEEEGGDSLNFNNVLEGQENMEFAFLISEINEQHYQSMKTILEKFARLTGIMSSEWADAIVNNPKAGNVVVADDPEDEEQEEEQQEQQEQDDEENVCSGVINILPSTHKLTKKLITKMGHSVQNKQPKFRGSKKPSQILAKSNTCLLICERAINLPPVIVKSMHEVLANELAQLRTANGQDYGKICATHILGLGEVEIPRGSKAQQVGVEELVFSHFEDYLFLQASECWWVGEGSPNSLRKAPLHRLHFIMRTDKYFEAVAQIHTLLQEQ